VKGIDTNVLARYIVQDDPAQTAQAAKLIENQFDRDNPAFIHILVLCELVWVLSSAYGFDRQQIVRVLRQVLLTDCFRVQDHSIAWEAMIDYSRGNADYADYVIGRANREIGVETTMTFDKKAASSHHFTLVGH
jgi:predicted nucleic-acid-binding protein